MTRVCLISESLSKTGLSLWQDDNKVMVITACCEATVNANDWKDFRCDGCRRSLHPLIERNPSGYFSNLPVSDGSGERKWGHWIKFWFGIENATIEVKM